MARLDLRHFKPEEFRGWWRDMDPKLLEMLDEFRERLGRRVQISKAHGSLGRHLGVRAASRHNVDRWGLVMAADVMLPDGPDLRDPSAGQVVVDLAREVGFGGIGVYLHWRPHPGLHLDCRPLKYDGSPATWSRVDGIYVAMEKAWESAEEGVV